MLCSLLQVGTRCLLPGVQTEVPPTELLRVGLRRQEQGRLGDVTANAQSRLRSLKLPDTPTSGLNTSGTRVRRMGGASDSQKPPASAPVNITVFCTLSLQVSEVTPMCQ